MLLKENIEEFCKKLIAFYKPLMLDVEKRSPIAKLMNAEADLRLTFDLALEAKTAEDARQKLQLAYEQASFINSALIDFEEEDLADDAEQIQALLQDVLNLNEEDAE